MPQHIMSGGIALRFNYSKRIARCRKEVVDEQESRSLDMGIVSNYNDDPRKIS